MNPGDFRVPAIGGIVLEPLFEAVCKQFVDFDKIETIVGPQQANDLMGDRSGSRTDFENSARAGPFFHRTGHCGGEKSAARRDRPGRFEPAAKLREEGELVPEKSFHK